MTTHAATLRTLIPVFLLWHVTAALTTPVLAAPPKSSAVVNGEFESDEGADTTESIPGWTTYGAPTSSIAIVNDEECGDGLALKVSKGKAFCYDIPLRSDIDYVLTVRVRAQDATARIELDPAAGVHDVRADMSTTFKWRKVEIPLPASSRVKNTKAIWIALTAQGIKPGGAAWFDDIRLEPMSGGPDTVPNGSFAEPALTVTNIPGWIQHSGGVDARLDVTDRKHGRSSLRLVGRGRPVKIVQTVDFSSLVTNGTTRVRISAWGRCTGLAMQSVQLVVQGAGTPLPPVLCMTGSQEWTKGQVVFDLPRGGQGRVTVAIEAGHPFSGQAWFDSIRAEAVPEGETVNLLWNTGFHQATTNPRLPDFWGVYGNATLCIDPWSFDYFGIDDREASPVPGTRVLRMQHPRRGTYVPVPPSERLSFFVPHGGECPAPPRKVTFSVYVKSASPGTVLEFRHPASQSGAPRTLGTSWERIAITGSDSQHLPSLHLPTPGSIVWMTAPQLETGTTCTGYTPSQGQVNGGAENTITPPATPGPLAHPQAADSGTAWKIRRPLVEAFAEYDLYTNEPRGRGLIRWAGRGRGEVSGRLLDASSGAVVVPRLFTCAAEADSDNAFEFDVAPLSSGRFIIQTVAFMEGKKAARSLDTFTVVRGARHSVRSSRTSRSVVVDGRPFFPIFIPIEPHQLADWHLTRLRESGFNTLIAAPAQLNHADVARKGVPAVSEATLREQLDRLSRHGMRFVWPLSWTFSDWHAVGKQHRGDISVISSAMRHVVRTFRDHPAIIGWYIIDEPSPGSWESQFGFQESDLAALHDQVKAEDPTRPCYVNWNHSWAFEPYGGLACTDVISHDNYSISNAPFDLAALVPTVRMLNDERAARKPAFAWTSGSYDELKIRPNADAVRVHSWLHVVYGTRGLGYWSRPPLDPDAWSEIRRINGEVTLLHDSVFGRSDAQLITTRCTASGLHYVIWIVARRAYVIGVNTQSATTHLRLDLRDILSLTPIRTRRLFASEDGAAVNPAVLADSIAAWQRFVYEVTLPDADSDR